MKAMDDGTEVGQKRKQWRRVNWNGWTGPIQAVAGGQCEFACWMRRNGMERMDRILSLDFGCMEICIAQEIAPYFVEGEVNVPLKMTTKLLPIKVLHP